MKPIVKKIILFGIPIMLLISVLVYFTNPAFMASSSEVNDNVEVFVQDDSLIVNNANEFPITITNATLYQSGDANSAIMNENGKTHKIWQSLYVNSDQQIELSLESAAKNEPNDLFIKISIQYGFRLNSKKSTINMCIPVSS